jgi:hypothetical protein
MEKSAASAERWSIRCIKCKHTAEITASLADLAKKILRCECCGHRQSFAPEMVERAPRRPNGRRARAARRAAVLAPGELNDRLDDLWRAK